MRAYSILVALALLPVMAEAGIVKGRVTANGKPLAGVQVSDGRQIVLTNANGKYSMNTDKADSVVFITTPSGYRATMLDEIRPGFWQLLTEAPARTEVHDFTLEPEDQKDYSVIFITDCHFAADPSRNDLERFTTEVLPVIQREYDAAAARGPVYSMNLGDFSHDLYWYDFALNEYGAEQFLAKSGFPAPVYTVTGNHDNDGAVAGLGGKTDFCSAWNYRHTWGPACYSVNIGADHWIFMDSVEYLNEGAPDAKHKNINGTRNYKCLFIDKYLDWLLEDLKYVPADTRIFLCCHVPVFNDASKSEVLQPGQQEKLDEIFKDFSRVYIYSGHTHKIINTSTGKFTRFHQSIFGATSGSMWQHPQGYQCIGSDGCNQSINVMDCSVPDPRPRYVAINGSPKEMRIYDINAVGQFYREDPQCRIFHKLYPNRTWYADSKFENMIYVNWWGCAPGLKLEVLEDGRPLEVSKVKWDDPLYVITYVTPKLHEASKPSKSIMNDKKMPHSFVAHATTATAPVLVRVSDEKGNVLYEEELIRPKSFNKNIQ